MALTLSKKAALRVRQGNRDAGFSCRLLPCDRGYALPAPYYWVKGTSLALEPVAPPDIEKTADGYRLCRRFPGFLLRQQVKASDDGCVLHTVLERIGDAPLPRSFNLLTLPGRQFTPAAKVLVFSSGRWIKPANAVEEGTYGELVFAVQDGGRALEMHSEPETDYPLLFAFLGGSWQAMITLPPEPATPGLDLGRVEIHAGADAQQLLEAFAAATRAADMKPVPAGWNSWDFYHSSITQEAIADNARALAADDLRERLTWCILDMGWETRFGEWEADPNFPAGMAAMAREIRTCGFQPGIWLAPIVIDPECNFMQEDYRWVGMNRHGFPDLTYECCGLVGYILDVTRPEGEEWLFNLFRRFREMGYTYFKLDFLRFLLYVDHFADRSLTPVQVMRRALAIARRAVGDDAYIMGCNLPFAVGPGYVDGARVSGDVAVFWENIRTNARAIAATAFLNGQWWCNDPDFLVVRGRDTYTGERPVYTTWWFPRGDQFDADPETVAVYRRLLDPGASLSLEEARTHASLEILLGGALVLGDPVMHLNEAGRVLLRKALATETAPGRPLRLFSDDDPPSVWVQRLPGRVRLGCFNWADEPRTLAVSLYEAGIAAVVAGEDFWTGETVPVEGDALTVALSPHHCRVVEFPA